VSGLPGLLQLSVGLRLAEPRDPPLTPDADEARSELRRELLRPEYNEQNVLQRTMTWVERQRSAASSTRRPTRHRCRR